LLNGVLTQLMMDLLFEVIATGTVTRLNLPVISA
jgi:hypothetical protein